MPKNTSVMSLLIGSAPKGWPSQCVACELTRSSLAGTVHWASRPLPHRRKPDIDDLLRNHIEILWRVQHTRMNHSLSP
jgi:hypothetical protein